MMARGRWVVLGCAFTLGCGGASNTAARQGGVDAEAGSSLDHPVMTCGPQQSYELVATHGWCSAGANPFNGDVNQAKRSRQGSQGGRANGHLVDVYAIPCPGGRRLVYVDMYGCPEYEDQLKQLQQPSSELTTIQDQLDRGQFQQVIESCHSSTGEAPDVRAYCMWLVPAAHELLGNTERALADAGDVCKRMPVRSAQSDARAKYATLLLATLAESASKGRYDAAPERRKSFYSALLERCGIDDADIGSVVEELE